MNFLKKLIKHIIPLNLVSKVLFKKDLVDLFPLSLRDKKENLKKNKTFKK